MNRINPNSPVVINSLLAVNMTASDKTEFLSLFNKLSAADLLYLSRNIHSMRVMVDHVITISK